MYFITVLNHFTILSDEINADAETLHKTILHWKVSDINGSKRPFSLAEKKQKSRLMFESGDSV